MTARFQYHVRLAGTADAAAIAAIYNQGIEDGVATFETEPRSADQIAALMRDKGDRYPTIVVEHDGRIVAWSGAGSYRARAAYAGIADHSVYVDRAWRRRGAGRVALEALFPAYEQRGFWKLTSRIFADNVASIALHELCGFRIVGVYRRHGRLHGVWKDCVVIEKLLGDAARDTPS